jgi:hypothetical protein
VNEEAAMTTKPIAAALCALAISLPSCGGPSCTRDTVNRKSRDLQEAMASAITNDPAKAATEGGRWAQKATALMNRAMTSPATDDICRAFDDLIDSVNKQVPENASPGPLAK